VKPFINGLALLLMSCVVGQISGQKITANAERARTILKEGIESKDPDARIQAIIAASMIGRNERVCSRCWNVVSRTKMYRLGSRRSKPWPI
jgi:hypothetical protein